MEDKEKYPLDIFTGEELAKLIHQYPELPIAFKAYTEDFTGDYSYEYASSVTAHLGEILDCLQDIDERYIFSDREEFEDSIRENLPDNLTADEFESEVAKKLAEYEPYWTKCILVTVGN